MSSHHINITENTGCLEQYLPYVASLDVPIEEKKALIDIVHSILSYFVDQAFGVQTDQITLRSINQSFNASLGHVTIEHQPENQTGDAHSDGGERDSEPVERSEP